MSGLNGLGPVGSGAREAMPPLHAAKYDAANAIPAEDTSALPRPRAFTVVGYGSPYQVAHGRTPLVVDAYGLELPDGLAVTYCRSCDCEPRTRTWPSAAHAADGYGGYVVWHDAPAAR